MPHLVRNHEPKWWKEAVVYEIYVSSFKDSNNDGIGDIPGIISKLDYLRDLGVDVLWISPHYKSPQVDMGYDISDYQQIHEPYGSTQDIDTLTEQTHAHGIKIIFDLVINHTSDQHPWFQESRQSLNSPKRDWYIWRPARYDANGKRCPPTNWRSNFGGPTWTWDEQTQQYYFHIYAPEQPDLNWENPECRQAIYDSAIRFWLDKGIDGFRVDTVNRYSKNMDFRDVPVTDPKDETQLAFQNFTNGPRIHEFISEVRSVLADYDVFTVGELPNTPDEATVMRFISAREEQLDMVFNFDTVYLGQTPGDRFSLQTFTKADFKRELTRWQKVIQDTDAWTTVFLENHDQGRSVSRFASDDPAHRVQAAKMLSVVLGTMTGTLYLYQGQEIGMVNAPPSYPVEEYKCIRSVNHYNKIRKQTGDDPLAMSEALDALQKVARDHARVPMQWDDSANAGFCDANATPWMRVLDTYKDINVASQVGKKDSVLEFWKKMVRFRKQHKELFVYGRFHAIDEREDLLVFVKEAFDGKTSLTVANLSDQPQEWTLPESYSGLKLALSTCGTPENSRLSEFEGRVYVSETLL
ncbi:oligo-1,6-glucosidase Ima1p [Trichomonascus vanleenenianus]|uniref:alpha-glucosidase n=1 Tax=Trichomonascus vanleenenianus TaxID=2268995 RepID=UPI003ECB873B